MDERTYQELLADKPPKSDELRVLAHNYLIRYLKGEDTDGHKAGIAMQVLMLRD